MLANAKGLNFEAHGISSSGSIIYKPRANMTIYGTFADSLQAPDTPLISAVPNYVVNSTRLSRRIATGRRGRLQGGVAQDQLLTALFRIERPFENT